MGAQGLPQLSIIAEGQRNENRCLRTGEKPVTPAFRKHKKEDTGNCKPVSFTLVPGKLMEWLILDVISKHLEVKKVAGIVNMDSPILDQSYCLGGGMTGWAEENSGYCLLTSSNASTLSPINSS